MKRFRDEPACRIASAPAPFTADQQTDTKRGCDAREQL
jgi:hypothetical protein